MIEYLPAFLTIVAIHLLAVMSPGPDFAMIVRNSLKYSSRIARYSALGLALGILIHVTYSLIGIGLIITKSVMVFSIIKYLGAAYLIYIGYKSMRAKPQAAAEQMQMEAHAEISRFQAIRIGFLTNALNPKVTAFFLSLFTQVIDPKTPLSIQVIYGLEMGMMTFVWFAIAATFFSSRIVKDRFSRIQHHLERSMGAILILLGIKVATLSNK